ncbi:phage tail tape measure protein [Roseiconus lacunae]|uniref:hypothetical protein n=1 Tax=Roseiconus lacunae TaxID=2605694 RepID=UPI001E621B05|nr:hypothetical protein [Roseiconus lacunae]MCD0460067.1 hypothetical protein [Roseiconus lacunae]
MNRRAIAAGKGYVEIGIRNRIAQGAKQVEADLKKLGKRVTGFGLGAVVASAAILAPLTAATQGFAKTGDMIHKMSLRTGVGAEALSGLGFAAEQSGSDLGTVEKGFSGLSRTMLDLERGGANSVDAMSRLGLSLDDLQGLAPEDQMMRIADALGTISDESQKGALAQQIFGRAGRQLLPLLKEGSAGMKALTDEAASLGRVLTEEDAASAAAFEDAMNRMKSVAGGLIVQVGGSLAPAMTELANLIAQSTQGFVGFISENRVVIQAVAAVAAGVGIAGGALVALGGTISVAGVAVGGLASLIGVLVSPLGIATAGVAALGFALVKYTDVGVNALAWLQDRFGPLVTSIRDTGGAIAGALQLGDTQAAWDIAVTAMELIWLDLTDEIRDAWSGVMDYVLDIGSNMASGLGQLFQGLSGMLKSLLEGYEKYYNKVYDGVVQLGGDITGVKTIGGTGNAFQSNFGSTKSTLESAIDQVRTFGVEMERSANGQIEQRDERRQAARKERDARIETLRASLAESSKEIKVAQGEAKAESEAKSKPGSTNGKSEELSAIEAELAAKKKEATDAMAGVDEAQKRTGPSGSFSAFAAGTIGFGAVSNEQRENAKLTALNRIAKNTGKAAVARFAQ